MGIIQEIFTGITGIGKEVSKVADEFILTEEEKENFALKMEEVLTTQQDIIEKTLQIEAETRAKVLVAELSQNDLFTKRARPFVIYVGVVMLCLNYTLIPIISFFVQCFNPEFNFIKLELPTTFITIWGTIASLYTVGRSMEKSGNGNKLTNLITGGK